MIKITSEQWELYLKKYNKLMWKIAHRISGDTMTASLEDNYSDLCIAAIESINGFYKKTAKSFDEMIGMKLFDQYTKTCLWTAKARKGVKLSERIPFRKKHVSLHTLDDSDGEIFTDIPDASSTARYSRVEAEDMFNTYNPNIQKLIKLLEQNPDMMTATGMIKIDPIAKAMNIPSNKVKKLLEIMENTNDPNR